MEHLTIKFYRYKCNNFGHTSKNCRSRFIGSSSPSKENREVPEQHTIWKKKQEDFQIEECGFSLIEQKSRIHWCVDSGCSQHMTWNKKTFRSLQEKKGTITFGNDNSYKILGKGTVSLGSKDALAKNVLLIENTKHNLLRVSQMCDQGHILIFNSKECEKREEGSDRLVATTTRTPNNIYILNKIGKECCCFGKEDESWIWHKIMGHIHFENLVKISKKQVVREMLEITKTTNVICKDY